MNFDKLEISFRASTNNMLKEELLNVMGVCVVQCQEKYLGFLAERQA